MHLSLSLTLSLTLSHTLSLTYSTCTHVRCASARTHDTWTRTAGLI